MRMKDEQELRARFNRFVEADRTQRGSIRAFSTCTEMWARRDRGQPPVVNSVGPKAKGHRYSFLGNDLIGGATPSLTDSAYGCAAWRVCVPAGFRCTDANFETDEFRGHARLVLRTPGLPPFSQPASSALFYPLDTLVERLEGGHSLESVANRGPPYDCV